MYRHIKPYIFWSVLSFALFLASCRAGGEFPGREYMPDMAHSKAYEYYSPSRVIISESGDTISVSKTGQSSRMPVKGTVPRGYSEYHYPNTPEGYEAAGQELRNPFNANHAEVLEKGKALYNTNCAICHGDKGAANGGIVASGKFPAPPPSYFRNDILEMPEGKMFHSIHYGKNLMGSYAPQLSKDERWKVVSYIKDMQAAQIAKDKKITKEDALKLILGQNTYKSDGTYTSSAATTQAEPKTDTTKRLAAVADIVKIVPSELDKYEKQALKSGEKIVLRNIFFETGSFKLRKESNEELEKLVKILNKNTNAKIEISGHTDSDGDDASNLKLSENRAKVVFDYLTSKNIAKDRLKFKGYGETQPVSPNTTPEGKQQNRRTEFKVL